MATPYIEHPEEVAALVARFGGDEIAVCAAWLHDTVEDCPPTSVEEIAEAFGPDVASVVAELTDDKALPKAERKRLQVVRAPKKSVRACLVKLADKCSNCRSIIETPPHGWDDARRMAYIDWSEQVVGGLAHCPDPGLVHFRAIVARARRDITGRSDEEPSQTPR